MKKMFFLSTMATLLTISLFWSCERDQVLTMPENEGGMLKSAGMVSATVCYPSTYSLVTNNDKMVGQILVSNDETYLTVEFTGNSYNFSEVQLWVGTDASMVPKNGQNIPTPGKFTYNGSGNAVFYISLSDLYTPDPEIACEETVLYIYAHVVIDDSDPKKSREISAWSGGTTFGTSRWGSYSTYLTCCRSTGDGGCNNYLAFGGETGIYNNTSGGQQPIYADNNEVAGVVEFDGENFVFHFYQDWSFSGESPFVEIWGLEESDGSPVSLASVDNPSQDMGIYTVPVSGDYPYYIIQFNLQKCTTEN